MKRPFQMLTALSGVLAVVSVLLLALSYCLPCDPLRPGVAIVPRCHIGLFQGALVSYSDVAFRGGTWDIARAGEPSRVRERVVPFPGGYIVVVHLTSGTTWSLQMPLVCPLLLFTGLPLVWLYRWRQHPAPNRVAGRFEPPGSHTT